MSSVRYYFEVTANTYEEPSREEGAARATAATTRQ
jgi:hypothetical protein